MALIRTTLKKEARITSLEESLRARQDTSPEEFETIVREIYRKLSRHWLAVKLMEKAAMDWPELASMWFGEHRRALLRNLAKYFRAGVNSGTLRRVPNTDAAARLVIEIVAFFAMHRRVDPSPAELDEQAAEETVVDAILHAYVASESIKE
ncbi:MAG: hypothetical protein GY953_05280 [bacterium]|nr:hypothetical protein [bacterium]